MEEKGKVFILLGLLLLVGLIPLIKAKPTEVGGEINQPTWENI